MTDVYTPLGYHRAITYNQSAQSGGDYGLPTDVTGDPITQPLDTLTPTRTPHLSISYDQNGNVVCYSTFQDSNTAHWLRAAYDSLNRRITTADADDASLPSYCGNPSGIPGIAAPRTQTTTTYNNDGSVASTQTPAEYASGVSTLLSYDADGNESSEVHHFGGQIGATQKWYDGEDRLVEVQQPHDSRTFSTGNGYDFFTYAWMTRYIYDLSQNNLVSVDGASFHAYGNLYKTEEYLPTNPVVAASSTPSAPNWVDVRGTAFDALDRPLAAYENALGAMPKLTNAYDASGDEGLLSSTQNAIGAQAVISYFSTGRTKQKYFQNDPANTPSETFGYDADGRIVSTSSSGFGAEQQTYDSDGRLITNTEPNGGGFKSAASISYTYYGDGLRKSLSVQSADVNATNAFQYSYREDGLLESESLSYPTTGMFSWTYTPAGRVLTQNDPFTGNTVPLYDSNDIQYGTKTLQSKTFSYDQYGRTSTLVLPEGFTYGNIMYDPEGQITDFDRLNNFCGKVGCPTGASYVHTATTYGIRGELLQQTGPGGSWSSSSANGFLCAVGSVSTNGTCPEGFDSRSSMMLSQCGGAFSYDPAGRQTQIQSAPPPTGYSGGGTLSRTYDTENHLISQSDNNAGAFYFPASGCNGSNGEPIGYSATYGWGPNGHPLTFNYSVNGVSSGSISAHWDGGSILFADQDPAGSSATVDFKVGKLAYAINNGLTVVDRDFAGQKVASHTAGGFSSWGVMAPGHPGSKGSLTVGSQDSGAYDGGTELISSPRNDGYMDSANNVFQGVRAFDNSSGQWTAPDAYAGDVHDPMTQKPFMWNQNSPLQYEDPSGYKVEYADNHIKQVVTDMAKHSTVFAKMLSDLDKAPDVVGIFKVGVDTKDGGGSFLAAEGKGGFIIIGTKDAHSDVIDTLAHEFTHAHDSLNRNQFRADQRPVSAHCPCTEPPTQEEVNGYSGAHAVDSQLGNKWDGPNWGPFGANRTVDWSTFSSLYHADVSIP